MIRIRSRRPVVAARVVILIAAFASGCIAARATLPPSGNFADGRFHNRGTFVEPTATKAEWAQFVRRMLLGAFPEAGKLPPRHVLSHEEAVAGLARAERAGLAVTWIGHATALIRMGDRWILTDPVLTNSIGAGLVRLDRLVPPVPGVAELPPIDVILISHADHDHLDLASLRRIARRNPEATVYVPIGVGPLVRSAGFANVHERDWFEKTRHGTLSIEAVPAVHGRQATALPAELHALERLDRRTWRRAGLLRRRHRVRVGLP